MLRRDMRELGNALGLIMQKVGVTQDPLVPANNATVDAVIES
jgi:hypothetical protein